MLDSARRVKSGARRRFTAAQVSNHSASAIKARVRDCAMIGVSTTNACKAASTRCVCVCVFACVCRRVYMCLLVCVCVRV